MSGCKGITSCLKLGGGLYRLPPFTGIFNRRTAKHGLDRTLESGLHGNPRTIAHDHALQLWNLVFLRTQIHRLNVQEGIVDRDDQ